MSLNQEERTAVVTYRLEKAGRALMQAKVNLPFADIGMFSPEQGKLYNKLYTLRLTGDYNDHYDLEEEDVLPLVAPAEELIAKVTEMAKQSLKGQ